MNLNTFKIPNILHSLKQCVCRQFACSSYTQMRPCSIIFVRTQSNYNLGQQWQTNATHLQFKRVTQRDYCTIPNPGSAQDGNEKKKSKKQPELKVTLINTDDSMSVVSLQEANKIADRRNLKLVKILDVDTKSKRPVYRLFTDSQFLDEEVKAKREKNKNKEKSGSTIVEKSVVIANRIGKSDFTSKKSKMIKWLEKRYEIRIIITGTPDTVSLNENIYKEIETLVQEHSGRIVQKRVKNAELRFQILPPKDESKIKGKAANSKGKSSVNIEPEDE